MLSKYPPGENPNSLKNLKKTAGPGRPKMTPEEKLIKKTIKEYMKEYLENGEAVKDFEKIRTKKPDVALKEAMDRIYGRIDKPVRDAGNSRTKIALLVQILTGESPHNEMIQSNSNSIDIPVTSITHDRSLLVDIESSG